MTKSPTPFSASEQHEFNCSVLLDCMYAWTHRDLDAALSFMTEDVVHILNIDGTIAPYFASVEGKPALRKKLQLLCDTFEFHAVTNDSLRGDDGRAAASFKFNYRHIPSRQRLTGRFRFVIYLRDGMICRIDEIHDAAYVEAFIRLVSTPRND